jgi:hypothetical protein
MPGYYVLNDAGEPVECHDLMTWARWFETANRRLAQEEVGEARVSTVFLGCDHNFEGSGPPVLWETLVFGGPLSGEQQRYTSRADAIRGHVAMVMRVREAKP